MKIYITANCIDSNKSMLYAQTIVEWNETKVKSESKLFELGLVKEYDSKADMIKIDKNAEILELKKQVEELISLVKEAVKSPKGTEPEGFEKYKG